MLHVLATKAYFPLSHTKITKKNRIKNLEHITEPWFKKKCCSILHKPEIKKKYKMSKKSATKGAKFSDTHVHMLYTMLFFILKTIKKDLIE